MRSPASPPTRSATPGTPSTPSWPAATRCAAPVLKALQDGRLLFSAEAKKVFFKDKTGKLYRRRDRGAGRRHAPADIDNVRLNNRLRGALDAAIGGADAHGRRSSQAHGGGAGGVQIAPGECRCRRSTRRWSARPTQRSGASWPRRARPSSSAWPTPGGRQDRRHRRAARARRPGRAGHAAGPAGRRAGRGQIGRRRGHRGIQESWRSGKSCRNLWYGLSLGSVLLLAAIGLAITFGVMGVINMAHGEMVMLGAYTTFVVQEVIRDQRSGAVRLFAGDRPAAGVPGGRRGRHPIERGGHPLSLRPAARDVARDLGPVARVAAGGALDLRPDQPRSRRAQLDERRLPGRPA